MGRMLFSLHCSIQAQKLLPKQRQGRLWKNPVFVSIPTIWAFINVCLKSVAACLFIIVCNFAFIFAKRDSMASRKLVPLERGWFHKNEVASIGAGAGDGVLFAHHLLIRTAFSVVKSCQVMFLLLSVSLNLGTTVRDALNSYVSSNYCVLDKILQSFNC